MAEPPPRKRRRISTLRSSSTPNTQDDPCIDTSSTSSCSQVCRSPDCTNEKDKHKSKTESIVNQRSKLSKKRIENKEKRLDDELTRMINAELNEIEKYLIFSPTQSSNEQLLEDQSDDIEIEEY